MTLNQLVAILAAVSLNANPSPHAIPTSLPQSPAAPKPPASPLKRRPDSLGVATTAKSAIVVDVASGAVLYAKDANMDRSIASLTKLMTAMIVLDQGLRPTDPITIELGDFENSTPVFQAGDTITREDALRAMLVGSVNEIANAFARTSPGGSSAFLEAMREKAVMLELSRATFTDPTGIDPRNRASATDVAVMLRSSLGYPEIRDMASSGQFDVKTTAGRVVKVKSTNLLLTSYLNQKPYRVIAGKTGSLSQAGYCLGQVTQNTEGRQVISVALGSADHFVRFQDVKALTGWAFETFEWK